MRSKVGILLALIAAALAFALAWVFYLQDQRFFIEIRRPSNVPKDAVYVLVVKGINWERCLYNAAQNIDKCEVWNEGGGVIFDGVYLPFDGGPPVKPEELRIRRDVTPANGDAICLENGRALLPKWLVDRHKEGSFQDFFDPGCPKMVGAGASR